MNSLRTIRDWFRPVLVGLFYPNIPWDLRWRLLAFQPLNFLICSLHTFPFILSRPFNVEYLPVRPGKHIRALIYKSPGSGKGRRLRPLHVEIHAGGFIGGIPEGHARYDAMIAKETGAVVISIQYPYAPENIFPAAIDSVDATIKYIQSVCADRWGADATLMTIGGFSAGGNLALAATQQDICHSTSPTAIKAAVTFYAPVDLRLSPWEKTRSGNMPAKDPAAFMLPLFDSYAATSRATNMENPRMHPILASIDTLPERILMVVPRTDIIVQEQLAFADRINHEDSKMRLRNTPRVEIFIEEELFHGYLEAPDFAISREVKDRAFGKAITLLKEVHLSYNWTW